MEQVDPSVIEKAQMRCDMLKITGHSDSRVAATLAQEGYPQDVIEQVLYASAVEYELGVRSSSLVVRMIGAAMTICCGGISIFWAFFMDGMWAVSCAMIVLTLVGMVLMTTGSTVLLDDYFGSPD